MPRKHAGRHHEEHQEWNRRVRGESEEQRLDRNWISLLQELRVVQTGVQLLTGLLLTLPFQARFADLSDPQRALYLGTVGCSVAATVLLAAPVGMHRLLFRRHKLATLVASAHRCALWGLLLLGLTLAGVVALITSVVVGPGAAAAGAGVTVAAFLSLWVAYPWWRR